VAWSSNRVLAIASAAAGTAAPARQSIKTIRARRDFSVAGGADAVRERLA